MYLLLINNMFCKFIHNCMELLLLYFDWFIIFHYGNIP